MYPKGAAMLHMLRLTVNDDTKWRQILRGLGQQFYHQTVTTEQVIDYINQQSGQNLTPIFDQYLRHPNIPTLEVRFAPDGKPLARWIADEPAFDMPVRLRTKGGEYQRVKLTRKFQPLDVPGLTKDNLEVDTQNYYIGVLVE
jgi:aminopeptidase N